MGEYIQNTTTIIQTQHNNNKMALALRFDRQTYTFAKSEQSISPICTDLKSLLDEVIGEGHGYCNNQGHDNASFNDLDIYTRLCAKEGCTKVEISRISFIHSEKYCFGLQAIYRSTFSDDSTTRNYAPPHLYCGGYYAYNGGGRQTSTIKLQEGEYLAEIRTRQGRDYGSNYIHYKSTYIIFWR